MRVKRNHLTAVSATIGAFLALVPSILAQAGNRFRNEPPDAMSDKGDE
jgi:hypothetical protein